MDELIKMIYDAVKIVYEKEQEHEEYLNQKDYKTCMDRAKAGWEEVGELVLPKIAASIAKHRIEKHGDDFSAELSSLSVTTKSSNPSSMWFE